MPKRMFPLSRPASAGAVDLPLIDFHTHILPEMDDGSRSLEESLKMLKLCLESGVTSVVLTPHFYADREDPEQFLHRRSNAAERLRAVLEPSFSPALYLGAEVSYYEGIGNSREVRRLCIEGTFSLLLEMPFYPWQEEQYKDVALLTRRGFSVVLAHVERYPDFRHRTVRERLREAGAVFQSNASFFLARDTSHKAMRSFRSGEIDLLASDCHRCDYRSPDLADAAQHLILRGEKSRLKEALQRASMLLMGAKAMILSKTVEPSERDT